MMAPTMARSNAARILLTPTARRWSFQPRSVGGRMCGLAPAAARVWRIAAILTSAGLWERSRLTKTLCSASRSPSHDGKRAGQHLEHTVLCKADVERFSHTCGRRHETALCRHEFAGRVLQGEYDGRAGVVILVSPQVGEAHAGGDGRLGGYAMAL